jgi:hypothetical protein
MKKLAYFLLAIGVVFAVSFVVFYGLGKLFEVLGWS